MSQIELVETTANGGASYCRGTNGAAHVTPDGAMGTVGTAVLVAKTTSPAATDILTSQAGFRLVRVFPLAALTEGSGEVFTEMVAVAYSYEFNDLAGVQGILAAAVAETDGTPSAPPVVASNLVLLRRTDDVVEIPWDVVTQTTIKTVAARACGATPAKNDVAVEVVL